MLKRYSLSDYALTITLPSTNTPTVTGINDTSANNTTISIGGKADAAAYGKSGTGGYVGSISVSRNEDTWDVKGDYTGGYVYTLNLNRTGKVTLNIHQMSDNVVTLMYLFKAYQSAADTQQGFELQIVDSSNNIVATCKDCRIPKPFDFKFGDTPEYLDLDFISADVEY